MTIGKDNMIECINMTFPEASATPKVEFDGSHVGIWIRNSEGLTIDGLPLMDPFMTDVNEVTYKLGVHRKFNDFCEKVDWYCEQYDAGTLMVYPNW
jgi:hypothetical protein